MWLSERPVLRGSGNEAGTRSHRTEWRQEGSEVSAGRGPCRHAEVTFWNRTSSNAEGQQESARRPCGQKEGRTEGRLGAVTSLGRRAHAEGARPRGCVRPRWWRRAWALGWRPVYQGQMKSTAGPGETYTPVILICPSSSRRMLEERGGKQML